MSQKTERPVLSGQRIKTRKRDEREKYDPTGFRDAVIAGLEKTEGDLEEISKFLHSAGNKLDYRRYGEVLFDILIAGGLLVPGGSISQDGEKPRTNYCMFEAPEDMESMRNHEQVFVNLMRRYKYLEKMFEEEMMKVLVFIKGFTPNERTKLARMTALWLVNGSIPPTVLLVLNNEHLIKDGIALDFLVELFVTFKQEKGIASLIQTLKKGGLESKLMEFFPPNKRTEENFKQVFAEKELNEIIKLHKAQASQEAKRELQQTLIDDINDEKPHAEIIADIKDFAQKAIIPENEIITIIWSTIMSLGEWNKKEELVTDQAVRHLKSYCPLFQAFTTTDRAELALVLKVQEFCYENMNFMKAFQKIILLFYKTEILSEEVIMLWYKESHSSKGKMHFLEQMKKFVEWLQNTEEGLKAVLLHNQNQLPSVPIAYATSTKETYEVMKKILRFVNYTTHKWKVIADLKVLTILFGMQAGYTKHPCYLCEWDSRAPNRYDRKVWPSREAHQIGRRNILNVPLVSAEDIILPPLHLKLGYMKQFVKKLDVNSAAFCYLKEVFPKLSEAKIKGESESEDEQKNGE